MDIKLYMALLQIQFFFLSGHHNLAEELIPLYWGLRSALESKGALGSPMKHATTNKRGNYMQQLNNLRGG